MRRQHGHFDSPVIVLGPQRSGTTLLGRMLASVPEAAFSVNGKILYYLLYWIGPRAISRDTSHFRADEVLHALKRKPILGVPVDFVSSLVEPVLRDLAQSQAELGGQSCAPAELIRDALLRIYGQLNPQASFWGDKYNEYLLVADAVHELFPSARYVALRRDPRAAAGSMLRAFAGRPWCPATPLAAERKYQAWLDSWQDFQRQSAPERSLTLDYEELRAHPEATLRRLSDFVEIPFKSLEPCVSWVY